MGLTIKGGKKLARSINFFKKRENWNKILIQAMSNVAHEVRDDAEKKVYQRWKRRTGKLGKSIQPSIYRRGNYTYIGLTSDHPAAKIMEYGGYSPMPSSKSKSIVEYGYIYEGGGSNDPFFELARGVWQNQPFAEGTFYMKRALREGLPDLESEIMRTAHRMKP